MKNVLVCLHSDQSYQQVALLEGELQAVKEERDDAVLKMTNAQEQADMNADSIKNLQTVLDQFQRGKNYYVIRIMYLAPLYSKRMH